MTNEEAIALLEDQMNFNRTMQRGWGNTMIETDAGNIVDGALYANQHKDVADALELAINALRAGGTDTNVPTMPAGKPMTLEQLRKLVEEDRAGRCKTLEKIALEYQETIAPGYRKLAEKAMEERDAAVSDLETIMLQGGPDTCAYCRNDRCYGRGGRDCCNPIWRGRDNHTVTEKS